jgi:predicted nucleic acid-binding protein
VREAGPEKTYTAVAALVDTNILVYRFDSRFPEKRKIAIDLLRRGIADDSVRVPHQAIVEFIAATTRPIRGHRILAQTDALREAEEFLKQFTVLYPNDAILREAMRACAAYQLGWFDAHLWAYAEHYGLSEILSEDFQHDRLYGTVRAVNPFVGTRA